MKTSKVLNYHKGWCFQKKTRLPKGLHAIKYEQGVQPGERQGLVDVQGQGDVLDLLT